MKELRAEAIETPIFRLGQPLVPFLKENLLRFVGDPSRLEGKVLAITSKIISLAENRIVPKVEISKEALVRRESDIFLGEMGYGCFLTVKHGLFIASAGIDESNAEGAYYILYPETPFSSAAKIRNELAREWDLKKFGVVITDSKTSPLRAGVSGVALAQAGFSGMRNKIGDLDLFGKPLQMTRINVADALAVAAVYCMGEGNECCPIAVVSAEVEFHDNQLDPSECIISPSLDLYAPLYPQALRACKNGPGVDHADP